MAHVEIENVDNGFVVRVDYAYSFSFRYNEKGLLVETSCGCEASSWDEKMVRRMRDHAHGALHKAGHMKTELTRAFVTAHQ